MTSGRPFRVVIVGSGIAGLTAALAASGQRVDDRPVEVTIVTKAELAESNTRYAQGGIAAVVFPHDTQLDDIQHHDSVQSHIEDTMAAGAGLADRAAVEVLCTEGPDRVRELIALGVEFDRAGDQLARGLEAAHSHPRVLHAGGDATGAAVETVLVAAVRGSGIRVLENHFLAELLCDTTGVSGIEFVAPDGSLGRLEADAVIIASGGAGQLYQHTTNPAVATGDGVAAALRAGADLRDVEFYQFHPTALAVPGNFLVSEAVRGEGAVLLGTDGKRFMPSVDPRAELAPRDIVARGIADQMAIQGGAPVLLDATALETTALGTGFLAHRFPSITRTCARLGIDWAVTAIPVTPAAHYWMGGIRTDLWGRTSIPGLFAIGEAACTGVHGANRLASNSLLEALVFGARSVRVLGYAWPASSSIVPPPRAEPTATTFTRGALQELMWTHAGLSRDRAGLLHAASVLAGWRIMLETVGDRETANLLDLARVIVAAALAREESLGAHFRSDSADSSTSRKEAVLAC